MAEGFGVCRLRALVLLLLGGKFPPLFAEAFELGGMCRGLLHKSFSQEVGAGAGESFRPVP